MQSSEENIDYGKCNQVLGNIVVMSRLIRIEFLRNNKHLIEPLWPIFALEYYE